MSLLSRSHVILLCLIDSKHYTLAWCKILRMGTLYYNTKGKGNTFYALYLFQMHEFGVILFHCFYSLCSFRFFLIVFIFLFFHFWIFNLFFVILGFWFHVCNQSFFNQDCFSFILSSHFFFFLFFVCARIVFRMFSSVKVIVDRNNHARNHCTRESNKQGR